jgi:hypothetical protein
MGQISHNSLLGHHLTEFRICGGGVGMQLFIDVEDSLHHLLMCFPDSLLLVTCCKAIFSNTIYYLPFIYAN